MKRKMLIVLLIAIGLCVVVFNNCKKDEDSTLPELVTNAVTSISTTTAVCGGNILSDGGSPINVKGVCWGTNPNPTISDAITNDGSGMGSFTSNVSGLTPDTKYYIRSYATNGKETGYGSIISFTTNETLTDIDGNVYNTVTIGSQTWMAENLKVINYNDGSPIPLVTNTGWTDPKPAYCWYNNDEATYKDTYGALYNWYTVNTGKLCPTGWHVPSNDEWSELINYLGGSSEAGGKLKESGTNHWNLPNTGATNESGFTALPGCYRGYLGGFGNIFYDIGDIGVWWSSTDNKFGTYSFDVQNNSKGVFKDDKEKVSGFSIRCLKD